MNEGTVNELSNGRFSDLVEDLGELHVSHDPFNFE